MEAVQVKSNESINMTKRLTSLFTVGTLALITMLLISKFSTGNSMSVTEILGQVGIIDPPDWVIWALIGAGSVTVIAGIITTAGWATLPAWALWALVGADTVAL